MECMQSRTYQITRSVYRVKLMKFKLVTLTMLKLKIRHLLVTKWLIIYRMVLSYGHLLYGSISSNINDQRGALISTLLVWISQCYIRRCIIVFSTALNPIGDYNGLN